MHEHDNLTRVAVSATLHCLTGCAIGEVLGMVIGTALGWGDFQTIVLAIVLVAGEIMAGAKNRTQSMDQRRFVEAMSELQRQNPTVRMFPSR